MTRFTAVTNILAGVAIVAATFAFIVALEHRAGPDQFTDCIKVAGSMPIAGSCYR